MCVVVERDMRSTSWTILDTILARSAMLRCLESWQKTGGGALTAFWNGTRMEISLILLVGDARDGQLPTFLSILNPAHYDHSIDQSPHAEYWQAGPTSKQPWLTRPDFGVASQPTSPSDPAPRGPYHQENLRETHASQLLVPGHDHDRALQQSFSPEGQELLD